MITRIAIIALALTSVSLSHGATLVLVKASNVKNPSAQVIGQLESTKETTQAICPEKYPKGFSIECMGLDINPRGGVAFYVNGDHVKTEYISPPYMMAGDLDRGTNGLTFINPWKNRAEHHKRCEDRKINCVLDIKCTWYQGGMVKKKLVIKNKFDCGTPIEAGIGKTCDGVVNICRNNLVCHGADGGKTCKRLRGKGKECGTPGVCAKEVAVGQSCDNDKMICAIDNFCLGAEGQKTCTSVRPMINEYEPDFHGDGDVQEIELTGPPNSFFTGVLVAVDSFNLYSFNPGAVSLVHAVSKPFDASGLLTFFVPRLRLEDKTLVLMDSFNGTVGIDLDTDNDGSIDDRSIFGTIYDAIGVPFFAPLFYAVELGGTNLKVPPTASSRDHVFRDGSTKELYLVTPSGSGARVFNSTGNEFAAADFDPPVTEITRSFGAVNPVRQVAASK